MMVTWNFCCTNTFTYPSLICKENKSKLITAWQALNMWRLQNNWGGMDKGKIGKSFLETTGAARSAKKTNLSLILAVHANSLLWLVVIEYQEGSSRESSSHSKPSVRLFHVHGTNEFNTRAIEVPQRSSSLNSNDVFVLSTDKCCYLWYGKVGSLILKTYGIFQKMFLQKSIGEHQYVLPLTYLS